MLYIALIIVYIGTSDIFFSYSDEKFYEMPIEERQHVIDKQILSFGPRRYEHISQKYDGTPIAEAPHIYLKFRLKKGCQIRSFAEAVRERFSSHYAEVEVSRDISQLADWQRVMENKEQGSAPPVIGKQIESNL